MEMIKKQPELSVLVAFIIGLVIGLVVLGWGLWPVQWTDAGPQHLAEADQARYIRDVADLYSFQGDQQRVRDALGGWGGDVAACQLAAQSSDPAEVARLEAVAGIVSGQAGCGAILSGTAVDTTQEEGGGSFGTLLLLALLLLFLLAAIVFVINRRNKLLSSDRGNVRYSEPSGSPLTSEQSEQNNEITTVPLAVFHSTFYDGDDTFENMFQIVNENDNFLGECGIAIAESIGIRTVEASKKVTALEIWLFDKTDVRTNTKVLMSDSAFFDDALRAKLEPKGEQILAQENEIIVLETASLILNAEITDLEYITDGAPPPPPKSYFDTVTVKFSVWRKEGDIEEPDWQRRIEEIEQERKKNDDASNQLDF